MARRQLPVFQFFQHGRGQSQQPQGIGHGGTGFSHPSGGFLLGQAVFLNQRLVAQGFFHRVQVLALQILNQGQLHGLLVVGLYNHHGDFA